MVSVSLPVLIVGPHEQSEFRRPVDDLLGRGALWAGDIRGALEMFASGYSPALVVVLQAWPGQFSSSNFDELRRVCPLARIVRVLGPWMEGELRTGRPVPGTIRVYWHEAPAFIDCQLQHLATGGLSAWTLPVTANEQDRLIAKLDGEAMAARQTETAPMLTKSMAIHAKHLETAESLMELCNACGWRGQRLREIEPALVNSFDAVILDSSRGRLGAEAVLSKLRSIGASPPTLVLVGFSRQDEIDQLQSAGAAAVLRKPFSIEEFKWHVEGVLFGTDASGPRSTRV
jgi:CheY-like chemotaxis protein